MNTITDNSIFVDEARMALKEMKKCGLDAEEGLETIDSYVNRVRTVCLSKLIDYVIETKLNDIQKQALKDYWFEDVLPEKTAEKLGISRRTVYYTRKKAQEILKDYLEPLIMYFRDMPSADIMPAVISETLTALKTEKTAEHKLGSALKEIRLTFGAETALAAAALGIKEKELIKKEKSEAEPTLHELESYSRAFGTKIVIEFNNGNGEIKWRKH